jgi:hypothetical protein
MLSTHFFSLFHPAKGQLPMAVNLTGSLWWQFSRALFDLEEKTAFSSKRTTALH